MTRRQLLLPVLLLAAYWARGQTLVNSAGASISSAAMHVEFSVGEIAVTTIQPNGSSPVTQGLLQPWDKAPFVITETSDPFVAQYGLKCYPNPAAEDLAVLTAYPDFETCQILDLSGQVLQQGRFNYQPVQVRNLPAGYFAIRLISKDQSIAKTLKFIKL